MENDYIRTNVRSVRGERGRDINYLRQCMDDVVGGALRHGGNETEQLLNARVVKMAGVCDSWFGGPF